MRWPVAEIYLKLFAEHEEEARTMLNLGLSSLLRVRGEGEVRAGRLQSLLLEPWEVLIGETGVVESRARVEVVDCRWSVLVGSKTTTVGCS